MSEIDIDLLAASLRADAADNAAYVEVLARKFEDAVPGLVNVTRARKLRGIGPVREIALEAAGKRLSLTADGNRLTAVSRTVSAGIVIKSQEITIDQWLEELARALWGSPSATPARRRRSPTC
jgi:hypothetical protein